MGISGYPKFKQYTEAQMPLPTSVPNGTEVFNTTYQVKMRSDGTRWIPLAPFFVYVAKLADEVTGTTALTLLREITLPHQYIGKNGNIEVFLGSLNNSNANTKRIVVSLFDGTTTYDIYNVTSTTTGKTMAKTIQAAGIEYDFYTSSTNAAGDGLSNSSQNGQVLDPALTTLTMRISGQLADASDWARLSRLAIKINGGF